MELIIKNKIDKNVILLFVLVFSLLYGYMTYKNENVSIQQNYYINSSDTSTYHLR